MEKMNLKNILIKATREKWAVGHFNISNLEQMRAIVSAAISTSALREKNAPRPESQKIPIMIGVSEGERNFIGLKQCVYLIKAFKADFEIPIFLNADHSRSVESAKKAFEAGFDSVHIDLSKLPYEENLKGTREVVEFIKSKNEDILVEGELGYLRGKSEIQKKAIEIKPEDLTKPEEAAEFAEKTGLDRFAGAFGNIHGITANEPKLDIERIATIRKILPEKIAIVLHGGSGIPDNQIQEAIKNGISNIHVNTEIRAAYTNALRKSLAENTEQIAPYKIFPPVIEAVQQKVEEKLKLFTQTKKYN
jgi:fructose-bisphosphate aldolase class II